MNKRYYEIRPIKKSEWEMAMRLSWDTFLLYEAPDYSLLGVHNFKNFVKDPILKKMFLYGEYQATGAFVDNQIIGFMGIRNTNHISLLFVDSDYHKNGIASALLRRFFREAKGMGITYATVNASPYAVGFYHKIGFVDLSPEMEKDGIRYTPMRISISA